MRACDLRAEVEHRVAAVDLPAQQREPVGRGSVDAGLARDGVRKAGLLDVCALARAEQSRRVAEGVDAASELLFELRLRVDDLPPRVVVGELQQVRDA